MSDKTTTSRAYGFQGQLMPVYMTTDRIDTVTEKSACVMHLAGSAADLLENGYVYANAPSKLIIDDRSGYVDIPLDSPPQSGTDKG